MLPTKLYFDGSLAIEGTESVAGGFNQGAFPHFNIEYTPPLISNYLFYLDNDVSCILTPTPVNIYQFNDCSTGVSWNNTDPLTLTIISGSEFASFYDINRQLIGDSFSGTFSELQDLNIIQDSIYKDAGDKYMLVQCEWGGLVRTDSMQLLSQTGDVIVANPDKDSLYTGQTVNVEVYPNDFGGECVIFFPFETTYNAEIIEGNEYGNLIDPNTGEHVQSFTELYQWFGYAYFDYVADGISPDTVKSIIIRISTSDPNIPYTDLTLYIKPSPIYVYTEPEVVSASDTANVIIKKRNTDGTLEDFPPGQTFELAVLDGCVNGNILVNDSVGVYFADAQPPVKFVTADSLESDSGFVRLRVGTDVSAFMRPVGNIKGEEEKQLTERGRKLVGDSGYSRDELRAGFEKMMDEKKAERFALKNKTGEEPPLEVPIVEVCYIGGYINEIGYWMGDVEYEKGGILDHFEITIIPDTLAFSETAKLIVQAKDAEDNDVELQSDKLLTFKVETNENYGTFIDVNGDTLRSSPIVLSNITYQNAKDGQINFAAVKENPDSFVTCLINVSLQEDTTKNGNRNAVVLEQTLKIEMEEPYTVYPTYFNSHGVRVYDAQLSQKIFDVKMTRGDEPVSDHPFKLYTDYVEGSGGHDHTNERPNNNNNYGYFFKQNDNQQYRPLEDSTSSLGRFNNITYVASYFGDTMRVYLESLENKIFMDSVSIVEMIPDLQILPNSIYYTKIGGTQAHHGPPLHNNEDHNHWGTHDVNTNLLQIAIKWNQKFPQEDLVQINDISLFLGGLFDVTGNWNVPHRTHKRGLDVDIRTEFPNQRSGIPIRNPRNSLNINHIVGNALFEEICREYSFEAHIHGRRGTTQEHYHLDFN